MAKVDWTSGSYLTPAFMNSYIGYSGPTGHNHEGLDASDSAPQVALSNCVSDYTTGSMVVHLDSIDPTLHPEDATWSYTKIGNICHLEWPASYGIDATNNEFKVSPGGGTWPAAVVPTNEQFAGAGMVSVIWTGHGDSQFRPGLLMIDNGSGDQWDFYTTDETTGEWAVDGFGTTDDPGLKGLMPGGCSYITD